MSHARPEDASEPEPQDLKFVDVTTAQDALSCQCEPEMPHLKPVSVAHRHKRSLKFKFKFVVATGTASECKLAAATRHWPAALGGSNLKAAGSPSIAKVEFYSPASEAGLPSPGCRKPAPGNGPIVVQHPRLHGARKIVYSPQ